MKQPPANFGKKHRWLRRVLLAGALSLYLLLPDCGFALDPAKDLLQYNCQTWSRQNGLPVNGINAITQTKDGYLWLGTSVGLVRFDGIEFKQFDLSHVAQLRNTIVTSLASARDGGLWVGLDNSAFGFHDGQSFSFRGKDSWGGLNMNVRTIFESKDGTLWLIAESLVSRLTRAGVYEEVLTGTNSEMIYNIQCGYEDSKGRIWFGTASSGVYYWQAGKVSRLPDSAKEEVAILSVAEDSEGQMWFGTSQGLYCYDSNLRRKEIPPLADEIRALLVDRHGILWIGTSGRGLVRYQKGNYDFLRSVDGLAGDYVKALAEDREGSLWIGTRNGVSQLADVKFPTQNAAEDPTVKDALAVGASHRGGVWIGSSAGVTYFDGKATTYSTNAGLPNPYVKRVYEARNGDLYLVNGSKRLAVLSQEKVIAYYVASNQVVGLAEDAHGVVASVGNFLYRAGTNYFTPYIFTNVQPSFGWILNLAAGRDGAIWVACSVGILRIEDGGFQEWGLAEGLTDPVVGWVCEDSDGIVWGALRTGIVRLKNNQIRSVNRANGLFDDNIFSIIPDDFGNLWVDSGRGIFRVSRQSMNDFADGKISHVECVAYDGVESVKPTDKTTQEHVACKTSDGRIWFPSAKGVVMIDPAHILTNQVAPPVHIERVLANGKEFTRSENIVIPPGHGELEVHFTALSFIAPQKVRFRYQLEGYDKGWVEAGDRRLAFYTNLKPGRYAFHVIAANADGIWNETGDTLKIELQPFYYQTVWFRLLGGGLALAALIGLYLQRVRQLQLKQRALQKNRDLLEAEVLNRTAELGRSQALYHSLVDQMPAGIFRKDAEGRYVFVNAWFCRIKGIKPDKILGKTPKELAASELSGQNLKHPEAARETRLAVQGTDHHELIIKTGERIEVEEDYPGVDGKMLHLHVVKSPVFGPDGKIIGTQGMLFDVTEQKRAEAELSYERYLLRVLLDNSPDHIYFKDAQSHFIKSSKAQAGQFGVASPDEVVGKSDFDFFAEEHARPAFEDEQEIIRTGQPMIGKVEKEVSKGGRISWVLTTKMPFRNQGGKIVGTFGISKDITAIKEAENTLRESEERFRSYFELGLIGLAITSPAKGWIEVNDKLCEMLGYARSELLQTTWIASTHPDDIAADLANFNRVVAGEVDGYSMNKRYFRKDGQVIDTIISAKCLRRADGSVDYFVLLVQDVTERKRLEAQLFQSQKMETVGKLAGGIAHEFNSILTAIIGQSELLLSDLPAGSPLTTNATEINKAASRAATLTRQLLAYGRKQFLQPEALDLNQVITSMQGVFHHLMGSSVETHIIPAVDLRPVKADAGQIEQVIMNMAINARDAMPNGGKLTLETANVSFDLESVGRYPELKPGDYAMLAITDTGAGMNESVKARLFEPFFSTKDVGQGVGLGLSTCYGIIKQSGGHISVYSELARGTTFKIYLPQEQPKKNSIQRFDSPDLPSGNETILLVEDDPALREMAAALLRRLGYTVFTAGNGVEALSLKHEQGTGHIDLLFTDVVMPHMSGKELADRVRALYPHTKILFTSAYTENAIVHQGVLNKGVDLLQKPFTPSALAHKLREVLDQKKTPGN